MLSLEQSAEKVDILEQGATRARDRPTAPTPLNAGLACRTSFHLFSTYSLTVLFLRGSVMLPGEYWAVMSAPFHSYHRWANRAIIVSNDKRGMLLARVVAFHYSRYRTGTLRCLRKEMAT